MPHHKKPAAHHGKPLSDKTVVQLRHMASKMGVKQTRSDGSKKDKSQLIRSIHAAK